MLAGVQLIYVGTRIAGSCSGKCATWLVHCRHCWASPGVASFAFIRFAGGGAGVTTRQSVDVCAYGSRPGSLGCQPTNSRYAPRTFGTCHDGAGTWQCHYSTLEAVCAYKLMHTHSHMLCARVRFNIAKHWCEGRSVANWSLVEGM